MKITTTLTLTPIHTKIIVHIADWIANECPISCDVAGILGAMNFVFDNMMDKGEAPELDEFNGFIDEFNELRRKYPRVLRGK